MIFALILPRLHFEVDDWYNKYRYKQLILTDWRWAEPSLIKNLRGDEEEIVIQKRRQRCLHKEIDEDGELSDDEENDWGGRSK